MYAQTLHPANMIILEASELFIDKHKQFGRRGASFNQFAQTVN